MKYRIRTLEDLARVFGNLKTHLPADLDLEIKDHEDSYSREQENLKWKILRLIAKKPVEGKTYTPEAWNEYFKMEFNGIEELPNGRVRGISVKSKQGMSDYITQLEVYAAENEIDLGDI